MQDKDYQENQENEKDAADRRTGDRIQKGNRRRNRNMSGSASSAAGRRARPAS